MPRKKKEESVHHVKERALEDKILENLIDLQKVHIDLAEKFDRLTKEISQLLTLFELAAKSFSKHPALKVADSDKAFLDKIDRLLEQNKTIAKGLTIMEDQIKKKVFDDVNPGIPQEEENSEPYNQSIKSNRPLPKF